METGLGLVVVLGLAAARVAQFLMYDEGPFCVFERLREFGEGRDRKEEVGGAVFEYPSALTRFLGCHWCVGVWAGVFVVILHLLALTAFGTAAGVLLLVLAVSELVGLLGDITRK